MAIRKITIWCKIFRKTNSGLSWELVAGAFIRMMTEWHSWTQFIRWLGGFKGSRSQKLKKHDIGQKQMNSVQQSTAKALLSVRFTEKRAKNWTFHQTADNLQACRLYFHMMMSDGFLCPFPNPSTTFRSKVACFWVSVGLGLVSQVCEFSAGGAKLQFAH